MSTATLSERAAKGARHLDSTHPEGWADRVDPNEIRMDDRCGCVIACLHRDYQEGIEAESALRSLKQQDDWVIDHGFDFRGTEATDEAWAELDAAWKAEIIARQTKEIVS